MIHPSLDDILAGGHDAHVLGCGACRRLATLVGRELPPVTETQDLQLPVVDVAVYEDFRPLVDGTGGMGRISRARDRRLGRVVAIKQLRRGLEPAEHAALSRRFEREVRLTARLQHPAIVGVYEAGRFGDGEPFYAMPLLRGVPLGTELARRATLAERLALLPYLTTVAEAVAYAHEQGIVHRDLKPSNILIGTFGEAVVIDWGLAKDLSESADLESPDRRTNGGLTQLGVGTPPYMPPEQARGEEPDVRVDVYAVGATLYHLLAGTPPYGDADASEVRRALAAGPPRPLAELVPEVPAELIDIVERAMARTAELRFASAQALADELRRFQTGQLLQSRRYTLRELVRHFARRHRTAIRIATSAAVALVAIGVISVVRIARERDRAEASQLRAERELRRGQGIVASRLASDPTQRLDAIVLGVRAVGPELAGEAPVPEALQGLLDALTAGPALAPLPHAGLVKELVHTRDRLIAIVDAHALVVWGRSGRELATYPSQLSDPRSLAASPDGNRVVACGADRGVEVFELASGARTMFEARATIAGCGFLPDGQLITAAEDVVVRDARSLAITRRFPLPAAATVMTVASSGRVAVVTLDGGMWMWSAGSEPRVVATRTPASWIRFETGERHLLHNGADQIVRAWPVPSLDESTVLYRASRSHLATTFGSPDDRYIAIGLFDVDRSRRSVIIDRSSLRSIELASIALVWSSDPRWLVADRHGPMDLVDAETGGVVLTLEAHVDEPIASVDGARLATASRDGPAFLWDLTTGRASGMLLGHTEEIVAIARSPSGDRVVTASLDGTARIWRIGDGAEQVIVGRRAELATAVWLGDRRIVTGDLAGVVRVFDAMTGAELASHRAGAPISSLAVSSRGHLVVGSLDGGLAILDQHLAAIATVRAEAGAVTAVGVSPDGGRVVSGHADGSTRVWSAATGAPLAHRADHEPLEQEDDHDGPANLQFSRDGGRIFVGCPAGHTLVLDARDLSILATLEGRATGSLDDRRLVTTLGEGVLVVHDLVSKTSSRLVGHHGVVLATAVSRDGLQLASASIDGTARVWDVTTGVARVIGAPRLGAATTIAFADPDGIIVGYSSGALRWYPATPSATLALACAVLHRFDRSADVAPYCDDP